MWLWPRPFRGGLSSKSYDLIQNLTILALAVPEIGGNQSVSLFHVQNWIGILSVNIYALDFRKVKFPAEAECSSDVNTQINTLFTTIGRKEFELLCKNCFVIQSYRKISWHKYTTDDTNRPEWSKKNNNYTAVMCGMPTIQHSARSAQLSVHKLFTSCIRRLPSVTHMPASEWCQRYLPCYLFTVSNSGLLFFHVGQPGDPTAY